MIEAYLTLKIGIAVLFAVIAAVVLIICLVKKAVEVIALACKRKRKKKG